ncbi:hypothetical protein [Tenacibaculum finnmarkense]|uniref:hypothetical protein n=1 Tax=Tenacibaculum finnmarkense TaxID=2781243 RepID=UPI001E2D20D5|nr:hypothetical protein [Tenacibaculum finnmarkense]MCD8401860.1 hypothetical protein [Tenacibaculum finnmarkense genomovar finnmarkense]
MRVSELIKNLKLSFDGLKLYEQYLEITIDDLHQKLSDETCLKILEIHNDSEIQDKISQQKKELSENKKPQRRKPIPRKIIDTSEKFIGTIDWYYNRSNKGEYGFVKHVSLESVYFKGDVVTGVNPMLLKENELVIFEIFTRDLDSKRKHATKLYRVADETDIVFLISNSFLKHLNFLNLALNLANKEDFVLKEAQKIELEALFAEKLNNQEFLISLKLNNKLTILTLLEKLGLSVDTKIYEELSSADKFEILKTTNYPILFNDVKELLINYILEGVKDDYALLNKLKIADKKNLLEIVYTKIVEGVEVKNILNILNYLKTNITIDFNKLRPEILLELWFVNNLDFFPIDVIYNYILEWKFLLNKTSLNHDIDAPYKIKLEKIIRNLSEKERRELFYKSHYQIDEIKEIATLTPVLFFKDKINPAEFQKEFLTTILNKSSEFIKLYLFVQDYTDELDYNNAVIYTGFLSSEHQKIFFKKILMLITTNVLNVGLDDLLKIITFDYQDNVYAKSINGVGLDFTLSVILKIASDLKNDTITNQQTMFEIIANQIKTPQDLLEINGFFIECTGRTKTESTIHGEGEDKQISYATKKTDYKPRFSSFCDGRKALHKITGEPVLSREENLEFWWCENTPCFEICRTQNTPENWRDYTLEDVLTILDIPFNQQQYEIVLGVINKVNRFLEHLKCKSCNTILRPNGNSKYGFHRVSHFSCTNESCGKPDKNVYLSHCLNGKCSDVIDSRTTVKCRSSQAAEPEKSGWYICNNCLSCCSTQKLIARKNTTERFGYNYNGHTVGHLDLGIICCPKCGTETKEKGIDIDEYNRVLNWFKSKIGTDSIQKSGQREDGKWWFRWSQENIETAKFKEVLLEIKNCGFQVPNYKKNDNVQFISETYNKLNTISNIFECDNCSHIIDLNDKEEFDFSRVKAVKSFHSNIFSKLEKSI